MHLHFISRQEYSNKHLKPWSKEFPRSYLIEEGGRGDLASKGCETIVNELDQKYDFICLPVGTATTLKGICEALDEKNLDSKVLAFSALKSNDSDKNRIAMHSNRIIWFDETNFGGYGKFNQELIQFMDRFIKQTRIVIDPIYQGKMYFQLSQLIKGNYFQKKDKILCIHTGGNLGLYSKKVQDLLLC